MTSISAPVRYRFERFELQPDERRLLADGVAVRVGPHALDLLVALVERSGHLVTKDELLARVWHQVVVEENTMQVHVASLRKVLGHDAIATVSGRGYRFVPEVASVVSSVRDVPTRKHNLPHELTSFIGRAKEIVQVGDLMTSTRLLTLTGAGGCGKSRLALQVARAMVPRYPEGVWLVELAPLSDPTLIPAKVASALEIEEQVGRDLAETIADWLVSRHALLVLDNAEHMLGECAHFADLLLRRSAGLDVLATSREPLGIAGELTYRIPSLSLPDLRQSQSSTQALSCEAAQLFIDRARLHRPDFDVSASDAPVLASICCRLDGIALAIELAASRVRAMSLGEIDRRLDDRFGVLTGGYRTSVPRHRTLRSLIDWSYDLLGEAEKAMLRRVSVFSGGWTLEAAQRVCGGESVDRNDTLNLLVSLTDKSLVMADTHVEMTRFSMLATVRHYAQDRLRECGEDSPIRERHVRYFMEMAASLHLEKSDDQRRAKLSQMDDEHDNLRAALSWCEGGATRLPLGLFLVGRLLWLWMTRGSLCEGRTWTSRFLAALPDDPDSEDRGWALSAAGALAYNLDDYASAEKHFREALGIWKRLGNRKRVAAETSNLGNLAYGQGDYPTARALYEEGLALARGVDDQRGIALKVRCLGRVALDMGDYAAAAALLEEGVSISRDLGRWSLGQARADLGFVRQAMGDNHGARALMTEALEVEREFGNRPGIAAALTRLSWVTHDDGDIKLAKAQLQEALEIQFESTQRLPIAGTLEEMAGVSLRFTNPTHAARIWGRAQRLREEIGSPLVVSARVRLEGQIAAARSALNDDAAFDRAWGEGRSMTLDEVVRYALDS